LVLTTKNLARVEDSRRSRGMLEAAAAENDKEGNLG
jgi:hypothetical protein